MNFVLETTMYILVVVFSVFGGMHTMDAGLDMFAAVTLLGCFSIAARCLFKVILRGDI